MGYLKQFLLASVVLTSLTACLVDDYDGSVRKEVSLTAPGDMTQENFNEAVEIWGTTCGTCHDINDIVGDASITSCASGDCSSEVALSMNIDIRMPPPNGDSCNENCANLTGELIWKVMEDANVTFSAP